MVADLVSHTAMFTLFQEVDDRPRDLIVFSSAADERVKRHVLAVTLVHVERMNCQATFACIPEMNFLTQYGQVRANIQKQEA